MYDCKIMNNCYLCELLLMCVCVWGGSSGECLCVCARVAVCLTVVVTVFMDVCVGVPSLYV